MRNWRVFAALAVLASAASALPNSCESPIYCHGELLHVIQSAQLYPDSKSFVDKSIVGTVNSTLEAFAQLMTESSGKPSKSQLLNFVETYFEDGNELRNWTLPDYNPEPAVLGQITVPKWRDFAADLIAIWPKLARIVREEVVANPEHYSLIPVPHGFVVPGGRFKEIYYWDSFWILQGLLVSDMHETTKGMLDNLIFMVQRYGFVPNGGRVYFTQRSQPPLLTAMATNYVKASGDIDWLRANIAHLDTELHYWLQNKMITVTIDGADFNLARYGAISLGPRPESYIEDIRTAAVFPTSEQQQEVYVELKSGAESGWDFSSRWFLNPNSASNLSTIVTRRIVPVDLNAFLARAFREIAGLYGQLGMTEKETYWQEKYNDMRRAIEVVLFDKTDGVWYDFDLELKQPRRQFYISNVAPLWARAGETNCEQVLTYLERNGIFEYYGGTPSTLHNTGEQWDLPNAWPPLQHIMVDALEHLDGCAEAKVWARELAVRWLTANHIGYSETHEMFEKYDAEVPGQYGGGGEYNVQSGFGWTNGVALEYIQRYFTDTSNYV